MAVPVSWSGEVAADRPVEAELRLLNAHARTNPVRTAGIPWQAGCRAWWGSRAGTPSTPTSCAQAATLRDAVRHTGLVPDAAVASPRHIADPRDVPR